MEGLMDLLDIVIFSLIGTVGIGFFVFGDPFGQAGQDLLRGQRKGSGGTSRAGARINRDSGDPCLHEMRRGGSRNKTGFRQG